MNVTIGFAELLLLLFLGLKLSGAISWSWWWVMAPLWLPAGAALVVGMYCFVTAGRDNEKEA